MNNGDNFSIYIVLIVVVVLFTVDILEIRNLVYDWTELPLIYPPEVFENCHMYPLVTKTVFNVFSLIATISAFVLTLLILIDADFFIQKSLDAFLHFNFFIFGPLLLFICSLAFVNFKQVFYVCDDRNFHYRYLSLGYLLVAVCCFIVSFVVTISVSAYTSVNDLIASILRPDPEIPFVRRIFMWAVYRNRFNENEAQREDEEARLVGVIQA